MPFNLEQFITQTKLGELFQQQKTLIEAYQQIEEKSQAIKNPIERNNLLYESLESVTFADKPLHPKIKISIFTEFINTTGPTDIDLMTFWTEFLESELQLGIARATINAIYGVLLEEKNRDESNRPKQADRVTNQDLLKPLLTTNSLPNLDWYRSFLKTDSATEYGKLHPSEEDRLQRSMDVQFLAKILDSIRTNPFRPPTIHNQINEIIDNKKLLNEFSDAITIMLEHLYEWSREGVGCYSVLAGRKWRLFLDETLPDAVMTEVLGDRWPAIYSETFNSQIYRMKHSFDLNSVWTEEGFKFLPTTQHINYQTSTIQTLRNNRVNRLNQEAWKVNYSAEDQTSGSMLAVGLVHAEIELWKAAFPGQPLWVLKYDIKDFYPSLSHDLILATLEEKGVRSKDLTLLSKWLRAQIKLGDEESIMINGLPNDRTLSHALGESILTEMERFIYESTPVQIVRIVDDICILAASEKDAFQATQKLELFLKHCGLMLNPEKSGAVVVAGKKSSSLPDGLPTWRYVQLTPHGEWSVDTTAVTNLQELTYQIVLETEGVFAKVDAYNMHLRDLLTNIGMQLNLGSAHMQEVKRSIETFHNKIMDGDSIQAYLNQIILSKISNISNQFDLPSAWFYWPTTAGGLGLLQPAIYFAAYRKAIDNWEHFRKIPKAKQKTNNWQTENNNWTRYYEYCLKVYEMSFYSEDGQFFQLEKDFINRGGEVTGKEQKKLGRYWRWVLKIYGPQIINRFGSFRFLITELVPLQVIVAKDELKN